MFVLAWVFLPDFPHFRTGLTIVGVAPCIAMVLIWNMLAGGDSEYCAVLVAVNSLLQIVLFSPLAHFYLRIVPQWLGAQGTVVNISMADIARSALIFLGTPLAAGIITRFVLRNRKGADWYHHRFMPKLGPTALLGLLFTIVVMFSMQGDKILARPLDVVRVAIPLVLCFLSMFGVTFLISWWRRLPYPLAISQSFTVGSNNLAGHRCCRGHIRHRLTGGAGYHHWPANRGAGAGESGLRVAVAQEGVLRQRRPGQTRGIPPALKTLVGRALHAELN
jgi:ACR3 family arsenite transporter